MRRADADRHAVSQGSSVAGEPAAPTPSIPGLLIDMDHAAGVGTVFRPDGRWASVDWAPAPGSPIVRSVHMLGLPYLVATTDRGEDIIVELPTVTDHAHLGDRQVVYLDQQAWSKLALARSQPKKLPQSELEAAKWMIDLVEGGEVVLPYSAGVLSETTHWSDAERRRNLALTIATLSRGWQMLDPLAIRAREFEHVLAADPTAWPLLDAWTLTPNGVIATRSSVTVGADLPAELALTANAASSVLAVFMTVLDDEAITRSDAEGWADYWAALARHVAESAKPKHTTSLAVHGAIIADARGKLAKAAIAVGMTKDDFAGWLHDDARSDLGRLPALGLAREVTLLKILNSGAKWEPNDLVDIFYLVQAAGYADAVVGERGFVALIRQAQQRLWRPVTAHKTLAALHESGAIAVPSSPS